MNENIVISPCISVCKSDPISGNCYGCGRTDEEKIMASIQNKSSGVPILENHIYSK